jgi:hypothetical protein
MKRRRDSGCIGLENSIHGHFQSPIASLAHRVGILGVGSSLGAAGSGPSNTVEGLKTLLLADIAAPGDGRTPTLNVLVSLGTR